MADVQTFKGGKSEAYERMMGRWSRRLARPFLDFVGENGARVLDVGCGTGSLTFELARRSAWERICGVDMTPQFIDSAVQAHSDPRIEFRVGDAKELPFEDDSFDQVLSHLVLQFIPEADQAISEMVRVARPGATVAATTWDVRGGFVPIRLIFDTAAMIDPEADVRRSRVYPRPMSRPGDLAAAWKAAGLADVADTMLTIRMEFESFEDFWASTSSGGGPIADYRATLDAETGRKVRDAVRRAYLDGEDDGPRSYGTIAWAVKGMVT